MFLLLPDYKRAILLLDDILGVAGLYFVRPHTGSGIPGADDEVSGTDTESDAPTSDDEIPDPDVASTASEWSSSSDSDSDSVKNSPPEAAPSRCAALK